MGIAPRILKGHGPVRVIVSHGWMGDSSLFLPLLPHIDDDRFTYAFLDARGYGRRRDEAGPCSVEATAQDVLTMADGLGWPRFHVVGHSMGGLVAQWLQVNGDHRMASSILIAPVPASGAALDAARMQLLKHAIADQNARRELIDINTGRARDADWLDALLQTSLSGTSEHGMLGHLKSWSSLAFSTEGVEPSAITVIAGDRDPGCTEARMRSTVLAANPHAQLQLLEGTGHYPMEECPERLADALSHHLRKF